jgi:hypothetical protein
MVHRFTDHTMKVRVIPRYEDNKTYPILVKMGGGYCIVEMLGRVANEWNDNLPTIYWR